MANLDISKLSPQAKKILLEKMQQKKSGIQPGARSGASATAVKSAPRTTGLKGAAALKNSAALKKAVSSKRAEAGANAQGKNPWIEIARPNPDARLRIFTFHYAGGAKSIYRDWWKHLPEEVEVATVQLPGREERMTETPYIDFYPLMQALGNAIKPFLDKPYVTYGHCLGALTSFELTRQLRRQEQNMPLRLFLGAFIGPQIEEAESELMHLQDLNIDDFFDVLNGTPKAILENLGMMRLAKPLVKADVDLVNAYKYIKEEPLNVPITAFTGLNDKLVKPKEVEAWQDQTTRDFTIHMLPGTHFFLQTHPAHLMKALKGEVNRVLDSIE